MNFIKYSELSPSSKLPDLQKKKKNNRNCRIQKDANFNISYKDG